MDKKYLKTKNILFIIIFVILICMCVIGFILYKNNKVFIVDNASVMELQDTNIVVIDNKGVKYTLPNIDKYQIGDRVSFEMKNTKKNGEFIVGEILKIETISKSVEFTIIDSDENITTDIQNQINNNVIDSNIEENIDEKFEKIDEEFSNNTEEDVIAYFMNLEKEVETTTASDITSSLKNGFVTVVDFLFYDRAIKGKTFSELSDTVKLKVLILAFSIDNKIEEKFPGYKEEIKDSGSKAYSNIKTKILEMYLNIAENVCSNNLDACNSAKEGLTDLKNNFSITWSFIKEISGIGVSKLKSWYEIWRES